MLTDQDREQLIAATRSYVDKSPPVLGVVGISGVGKSSTLNAMFGTRLPISHTTACTKAISTTDLQLVLQKGEASGEKVQLQIVDAPGLGESINTDPAYIQMYQEHLERCDVVVWIFSARNRALALDQTYLKLFSKFLPKIVFAVNQCDSLIEGGWNEKTNLPTDALKLLIEEVVEDRQQKLSEVTGIRPLVTAYSAQHGFRLQKLFRNLIERLPAERRWLYDGIRAFSYKDFVPTERENT
jgi:uncharacterized protein